MQVKKFEARTMKEALEMVKTQLGPDAIILSARDNNRSFGLVGDGSVEITAAVSDETLQKKKFVESRLRTQDRETFTNSPAKIQKTIIDKMVNKYVEKNQPPRAITSQKYADIEDEGVREAAVANSRRRIEPAVNFIEEKVQAVRAAVAPTPAPVVHTPAADSDEVVALKGEVASLRHIIAQFQGMPQNMVSSHPGADYGIPFELSFMYEKLTSAGIAGEIAAQMLVKAQETIPALKLKNRALVDGWVARHILETTRVTGETLGSKVHLFMGPAGSGKTTSLVKMASHLVVKERLRVAVLTTDTFKVGAADQMRIYAQILNVPFAIIRSPQDWNNVMRYLGNVDAVLVDMPGVSLKSAEEAEKIKNLMPPPLLNPRIHFVASTMSKDGDVTESARRYSTIGFDDVIFTGLDESVQHGTIYNFCLRFKVPLHSFGIGPRVPEDFEFASRERVLDLLFKITKQQQLMGNL